MMKKAMSIIFCVCILIMLVFCIRYVNSPVNAVSLEHTTHEEKISAKGFIVRDERVYYARNTGTIYNHATEGERVSKDMIVSTVYSGVIGNDTIKELSTIDRKINEEISTENKETFYAADASSVESAVSARANSIFDAAREKDIQTIAGYKSDINKLRAGEEITKENRLSELEAQKQAIEDRIGLNKSEIFTEISGIFTTYLDGLESVLTPNRIMDYDVEYIEGLMGQRDTYGNVSGMVKTGDPICKVVNNHLWYVVAVADAQSIEGYKKGAPVTVRFNNITGAQAPGTISYISEVQADNKVLVMIKCPEYLESAFAYREADIDLIFKSYTGYKVPIQAIRTDDGKYSVLATAGNKQVSCECDVLYSDTEENVVIIKSTDTALHKLNNMDKVIVGER
ncbi:MAG: HlyD family efflux transporter periplasmic adaptor subunit [Clostridia bacterium]|nr:HlyD family efflux transporter periplasmic adaptor subunit [Clostridia bacterium]